MPRSIRAFTSLRLIYAGIGLTILGSIFKLRYCIQLQSDFSPAKGSVGWYPRSVWIDWGPVPQGFTVLGLLMALSGASILAFRAAPRKMIVYGVASSVLAGLTLNNSEVLRCAAFGPLLVTILVGVGSLVIGLLRYTLGLFHLGKRYS